MLSETACPDIWGKSRLAGKKLSLLFIAFLLLQINTPAQAPDTMWTKTFGEVSNDRGYSIQQTVDGGYILTGMYNDKRFLMKLDLVGNILWGPKFYPFFWKSCSYSVKQTIDLGYIIAGYINVESSPRAFVIKTDTAGNLDWDLSFSVGETFSVIQTSDSGYICTGYKSGLFLTKTDKNGDTLWTKIFGNNIGDVGYSVYQTSDGGYIIGGSTNSFGAGEDDIWLLKTNENGDTSWTKTFGGVTGEEGNSVQQTIDGGYIIVGYTDSFGAGEDDIWLIKTDENGDTLWTRTYGGSNDEEGFSVYQTTDGGYVIAGYTNSFGAGAEDVWIIKTDSSGDTLWNKTLGGDNIDCAKSIRQTTDGGYIVTGYTSSFGAGGEDVW
jgi:hypothetical protein